MIVKSRRLPISSRSDNRKIIKQICHVVFIIFFSLGGTSCDRASRESEDTVQPITINNQVVDFTNHSESSYSKVRDKLMNTYDDLSEADILGVDINRPDANGETLLFLAVRKNKAESVDLLLDAGADISVVNKAGLTAFDVAIEERQNKPSLILIRAMEKQNLKIEDIDHKFLVSCEIGNKDLTTHLIELGANINATDENSLNCVMIALEFSRKTSYIEYLLTQGADINYVNDSGDNALLLLSRYGHIEKDIKLLIKYGINVNQLSAEGKTSLDYVFEHSNEERAIQYLIDAGGVRSN